MKWHDVRLETGLYFQKPAAPLERKNRLSEKGCIRQKKIDITFLYC